MNPRDSGVTRELLFVTFDGTTVGILYTWPEMHARMDGWTNRYGSEIGS